MRGPGSSPTHRNWPCGRGTNASFQTLAIYGVGIAIYTALVFAFYQTLSRRKPLHFKLSDRVGWRGRLGRTAERVVAFPVASFLYFAVLAVALFVMAKSQSVEQILLLSMATIVGVRVTVHLSEAMSNDLAKLVPLSLIAVVLVDPGYLTFSAAWGRFVDATRICGLSWGATSSSSSRSKASWAWVGGRC